MTESRQPNGEVIFTQGLQIGYLDGAEMHRIAERRKFHARLRRLRNRLIVLGVFIFLIWLMVRSHRAASQREARFGQLVREAAPYSANYQRAAEDREVQRFSGQALAAWGRAVHDVSSRLNGLLDDPDASGKLNSFRQSLKNASAACAADEAAMRQALIEKSREACPMHPYARRDPREQVCPYAPKYHHRFEVWVRHDGAYCWREGKRVQCKRLGDIDLCGR